MGIYIALIHLRALSALQTIFIPQQAMSIQHTHSDEQTERQTHINTPSQLPGEHTILYMPVRRSTIIPQDRSLPLCQVLIYT
jgi:hypothetical protein